jgi:single-strand DNA-binding protein
MNDVTLVGTAFGVEVRYSQSGMAIAKFNVSQYDGKDKDTQKPKYFSTQVVCFKELAEEVGNSIQDRDGIVVIGRRSQESWDDRETGKKRYKDVVIAEVIAKNIKQFGKKSDDGNLDVNSFGKDVFPDEEIPF